MQRGLVNFIQGKSADQHGLELPLAAFAEVQNSPVQRCRIRLALAIALDQSLGEKIGHTMQSVVTLPDDAVISLYETLRRDRRVP